MVPWFGAKLRTRATVTALLVSATTLLGSVVVAQEAVAEPEPPRTFNAGPVNLTEQRLLTKYTYSYATVAADLDGDGDLDLTSSDAEPNSNLYRGSAR